MNTNRDCGCKGFNTCALCEEKFGLTPFDWGDKLKKEDRTFYEFSIETQSCINVENDCDMLTNFSGIKIIENFVSEDEEAELIKNLDLLPWSVSQSGRRKQNFGPKANFKKRKAKVGSFEGFPKVTKFIQDRFSSVPILEDYKTVEQCSIEYTPETGACIDPHIDDCWIWGERIVQLNLLSSSYLTCAPYSGTKTKYNLPDVDTYPRVVDSNDVVTFNPFKSKLDSEPYVFENAYKDADVALKIPLPPRSLLIMHGQARYEWEHAILRSDVHQRRIVIAYRELTPSYLPGGREEATGKNILDMANQFW